MKFLALCLGAILVGVPGELAAQAQARPCSVIVVDSLVYGVGQFHCDCDVDQLARRKRSPSPSYSFSGDSGCVTADIEFGVDETGLPVASTAHVIAASSARSGVASLRALKNWRYDPATKDGIPVKQVVRARIAK